MQDKDCCGRSGRESARAGSRAFGKTSHEKTMVNVRCPLFLPLFPAARPLYDLIRLLLHGPQGNLPGSLPRAANILPSGEKRRWSAEPDKATSFLPVWRSKTKMSGFTATANSFPSGEGVPRFPDAAKSGEAIISWRLPCPSRRPKTSNWHYHHGQGFRQKSPGPCRREKTRGKGESQQARVASRFPYPPIRPIFLSGLRPRQRISSHTERTPRPPKSNRGESNSRTFFPGGNIPE